MLEIGIDLVYEEREVQEQRKQIAEEEEVNYLRLRCLLLLP